MINNPASYFVDGNHTDEFSYEGGEKLFHFSPKLSGLSKSMEMNIIFFANDYTHAKEVLKRMFEFAIKCYSTDYSSMHEDINDRRVGSKNYYKRLLENEDKWIVIPAPTNHVMKVSWASNDTI